MYKPFLERVGIDAWLPSEMLTVVAGESARMLGGRDPQLRGKRMVPKVDCSALQNSSRIVHDQLQSPATCKKGQPMATMILIDAFLAAGGD